jgi:aspartate racemase
MEKTSYAHMKTIGLIGGTSWVSTADYYRLINQLTTKHLGGINSAQILMYSVNYVDFRALVDAGEWDKFNAVVTAIAKRLEQAGADCILLCANTMHMAADAVQQNTGIPLLHIAEVTAKEIVKKKMTKIGLLGTKFTMEKDFFKDKLKNYGIETLIPGADDREFMHCSIFDEMGVGNFYPETKARYLSIIDGLLKQGVEGIIFGCTEIPMLIPTAECTFPVFDTLEIHAKNAVAFALGLPA